MTKRNYLTHYGIRGFIRLCVSKLYTLLRIPSARLIRLPVDIRFKKNICWGNGLTTGIGCRIEAYNYGKVKNGKTLFFGNNIEIGDYVHIAAGESVTLGDNVLIASKVFITDMLHGNYSGSEPDSPETIPNKREISIKQVKIESNVWIGESVSIMPDVTIGKGSIIGANSVVTKSIPAFCIAAGNPAFVIKKFNFSTNLWERVK